MQEVPAAGRRQQKQTQIPAVVSTLKNSLLSAFALGTAGIGDAFLYVYIPSNYKTLGLSLFWVGIILSVNRFVRLFLNSWMAFYLTKFGIKQISIVATLVAAVTTISYGLVDSLVLWLIVRILWGLCFSTLRLGSILYAMQHKKQGLSLGLSKSIVESGSVFALLAGPFLATHFSIEITFLIMAGITSIGAMSVFFLPDLDLPPVKAPDLKLSIPSSLNVVVLTNAFVMEGLLIVLIGPLQILNGVSPEKALLLAGVYLAYRRACLVFLSPFAGWLADKWGFAYVFNLSAFFICIGILLTGLGFLLPGVIIAFTFAAVNASVGPGLSVKTESSLVKDVSDNATWRDIGAATGTLLGGLFLDFYYLHLMFLIAFVPLVSGLVIHLNKQTARHGIS
jgi:MFS family permease